MQMKGTDSNEKDDGSDTNSNNTIFSVIPVVSSKIMITEVPQPERTSKCMYSHAHIYINLICLENSEHFISLY